MTQQIVLTKPGNYTYTLSQEGEEIEIIGAFALQNTNVCEIQVNLIHQARYTKGNIVIRATVGDSARMIVKGNIRVEPEAVGTDSFLTENILLLSDTATAEAVPNLDILNNDVHCSHAATIGQIDPEQLFYLQSRGIPEVQAKKMIADGFLQSVIDRIQ